MSLPEVLLWRELRRRVTGVKFRKQHPLPPYVLDFYCAEPRLVVEIDGAAHGHGRRPQQDAARDESLRSRGLTVMRIPARDVLRDPQSVADMIARALPLHHRPAAGGPPPHAGHGEVLAGAFA